MGCLAEMRRCYGVENKTIEEDVISETLYLICNRCRNWVWLLVVVVDE